MTRTQFLILLSLSGALVLMLLLQVIVTAGDAAAQGQAAAINQAIQTGKACDGRLRQVALRIYQVSAQSQDQGLKDILARQQIVIKPPASSSDTTTAPATH